jgi:hypothetical protein
MQADVGSGQMTVRWGLRLALVVATGVLAAGCGSDPASTPGPSVPDAPTAPVNAQGKPITSLCELLSKQDITEVTGLAATEPTSDGATSAAAVCKYGADVEVAIAANGSIDAASATYRSALEGTAFSNVIKQGPIGGVDESVYATGIGVNSLGLRRQKLVVAIMLPGTAEQAEIKLIQLAGRLLSRANALGT